MSISANSDCLCGSGFAYAGCCGPYLMEADVAPTAEALMRSRYVAYCLGNVNYLIATRHPSKRRFDDRINLIKSLKTTVWRSLTVVGVNKGRRQDTRGKVEFVAVYSQPASQSVSQPELGQLHERSQFVKENGRWFYLDGELLPPLVPKRNQPCWCGSGQKFKRCHG